MASGVWLIPPSVEQQLGAVIVPAYEKIAQPSATQDTLNQLLNRLETKLSPQQKQQRDYQVLYIPQPTVNALALPGDRIIIFAGLLEQVKSENELMMILGHELGHFANRDHLRGLGYQILVQIAIAYFFGDPGWWQSFAGSSVQAISKAQFSQSQETQADQFGLNLLQSTYGHVAGATDFFTRLNEQKNLDIAFLASHPAPGKRVVELQSLIKKLNYPTKERSPLPKALANLNS
jgi:predicted Zn-dependent protease